MEGRECRPRRPGPDAQGTGGPLWRLTFPDESGMGGHTGKRRNGGLGNLGSADLISFF